MPKIRAMHPEFWTDDDVVSVSPFARLLFAGLWNFACDNGHVEHRPRRIKLQILPADDVSVPALLVELAEVGLVEMNQEWLFIPGLTKRQKPDIRYFTTCSHEGCREPERTTSQRESRRAHGGHTTGARRANPVRTADARSVHATDGDGDGDGDGDVTPSRKRSAETPARFEEFWATYDHKVGRKKAEAAYRSALKKPGVTDDLLIATAGEYVAWMKSEGKHPQFTKHPTTWLNGEHWRDERTARQQPLSRVQQHLQLARDLADEQTPYPQIGGSA